MIPRWLITLCRAVSPEAFQFTHCRHGLPFPSRACPGCERHAMERRRLVESLTRVMQARDRTPTWLRAVHHALKPGQVVCQHGMPFAGTCEACQLTARQMEALARADVEERGLQMRVASR